MSDDAKKTILARRARFVAAAMASMSLACGKEHADPQPCLSEPYHPPDAAPAPSDTAPPQPCLSATAATAEPMPCLSVARPEDAGATAPKKKK